MTHSTPLAPSRPAGRPIYPTVRVSGDLGLPDLKRELLVGLERCGVTCDRIVEVIDQVRADRARLAYWVSVV